MTYLNVDALQESEKVRGSEWIKIGVDTGAGKTAWPQSITHGTMIPGDSDLTFRTATGELVKGGENTRRRVESHCCMVTKVTCSTKVRMLQRKLMLGSRRS